MIRRAGRAALWIVAQGHTAWAEIVTRSNHQELWKFDATTPSARILRQTKGINASAAAVEKGRTIWVVSDTPLHRRFTNCSSEHLVAISGATGKSAVKASIKLPHEECGAVSSLTISRHNLYFLVPRTNPTRLYRYALQ
jgi:outer membrane protein assembly factor BamB